MRNLPSLKKPTLSAINQLGNQCPQIKRDGQNERERDSEKGF